jgi:SAM-dependent methyltransferase
MRMQAPTITDVEGWNDAFARENDIDQYYAESGWAIRWIEGRRLKAIRSLAQVSPADRVIEVGCGGGHVLRLFPDCELTGVDVSGEMLRKASRNLEGYRVTLLKGELHQLNLPEGGFDRVICTEVLEHVVDPEQLLSQMNRLLKPGGRIVVTLPNDPLVNGLKTAIRASGMSLFPPFRRIAWGGDHYHLHVWSIPEMRALLSRHFLLQRERFAPHAMFPIRCCFQGVRKD